MTSASENESGPNGPLVGVRVIELGSVIMVPYATQILGDLGADVIKVEGDKLDSGRVLGGGSHPELSTTALNLQRSKRSIQLNLKEDEGMAAFHRLLASADIFITNLRPKPLERLGLDYASLAEIYPRLICCEAIGFRSDSGDSERPAYDDTIQSETGIPRMMERGLGVTRNAPMGIADKVAGLHVVIAVLAALVHQQSTGEGQRVELAMFDAVLSFNLVEHLAGAAIPGGSAGYGRILSPNRGPHKTLDGYVSMIPYSDDHYRALFTVARCQEKLDEPPFRNHRERLSKPDVVFQFLKTIIAERTTAEWLKICEEIGVPYAQVPNLDEIVSDPLLHRGVLEEVVHPIIGEYRQIRSPFWYSETPASVSRPAPLVGEHTTNILTELGYTESETAAIIKSGAARQSADRVETEL